ncbi:MAG: glycerophosphodiester phosphodiesterase family protein [Kiritimatiellae bacterium]|nr:glycerophosphodiester phosphodiesterase family protein [Kiritimatiellia bacterium]
MALAETGGVFVASHRADWQFAPENSLAALQNALHFGADIIETDVRMTKDGKIVMMHDPTVNRTTNGSGAICELTLDEIRALRLKDCFGAITPHRVPTLEEYFTAAKGKACLYLDKTAYDLPGHDEGTLVRKILEIARACGTLEETIFVLPWPYEKAKRIFGDDLEKVRYCPVIEDKIPNLESYVDEYLTKLKPFAFQFRMVSLGSQAYALLPKILASPSRAFVAATWPHHTAGHDDRVSLFEAPEKGWGWLIKQGFTILETNHPRELVRYLKTCTK